MIKLKTIIRIPCLHCGEKIICPLEPTEDYMLKDEVWDFVSGGHHRGLMHWRCAAIRLGREISTDDLMFCLCAQNLRMLNMSEQKIWELWSARFGVHKEDLFRSILQRQAPRIASLQQNKTNV